MLNRERYNGWPNYETWAVNVWLTNEPDTYERLMSVVQSCDILSVQAETLRKWIRPDEGDTWDNDGQGMTSLMAVPVGMYVDLLAAAFDMVHWREIIRVHSEGVSDEVGGGGGVVDADILNN